MNTKNAIIIASASTSSMDIYTQCRNCYAYVKLEKMPISLSVLRHEHGRMMLVKTLDSEAIWEDGTLNEYAVKARAIIFTFYLNALKRYTAKGFYMDPQDINDVFNEAVLNIYMDYEPVKREYKWLEIREASEDEQSARIAYNKYELAVAFGKAYKRYAREYQEHKAYTVSLDEQIVHPDGSVSLRDFVAPSIEDKREELERRHMSAQRILMTEYGIDAKQAKRCVKIYKANLKGIPTPVADRVFMHDLKKTYGPDLKSAMYKGFTRPSRRKAKKDNTDPS